MEGNNVRAIVLAAGKSTRFKTKKSKLLFKICGQTMILYPLRAIEALDIPMTLVLGHQSDVVKETVIQADVKNVSFVIQEEQRGTGHAVLCTQSMWDRDNILILYGDTPLLTKDLLNQLIIEHESHKSTVTFFTSYVIDPYGYGRVIEQNNKFEIIEEKDCTEEQRYINRVNAGVYLIKRSFLETYLPKIGKSSVTDEIYLPELIKAACDSELTVRAISVPYDNVRGVNTLQELWSVEQIKRSEFIKHWMTQGVRFELAQSIHIDKDVTIGTGTFIGTGVHLIGKTKIGEECEIRAFSIIENSEIGDTTIVYSHSVIQNCMLGASVKVGPFARLSDNAQIGNHVEIGNFVEMKSSTVGDYSKTRHLSYISHAHIGSHVKLGAGTITNNYDGVKNNITVIEDNVFVGSNNTFIAPVTVGKGAYTTPGAVINQDIPADALAVVRTTQINKSGFARKLREVDANDKSKTNIEKITQMLSEQDDEKIQFSGATKIGKENKVEF